METKKREALSFIEVKCAIGARDDLVAAYYVSTNWYQVSLIRGDSVSPAYHNLQFVLIDRHSDLYSYGDVVAFQCEKLDAVLVKRIAACPGDQVIIRGGTLYVNELTSQVFP